MRSVARHWCFSGFANTDLDLPLKKHAIHQPIVIGARTCIEATVYFAAERGCHVTMVKDATADYPHGDMHASREVKYPNSAIVMRTAKAIVAVIALL
jgi:ureidoacrylate peracid hydrolase